MKVLKEFRDFAMKGNVIDLAVGIILGGAFGRIVSSLVTDVLMPPIGLLIGGVDFSELRITMKHQVIDAAGKIISQGVSLNYGKFVQSALDFTLVAFAIFMLIQAINRLKRNQAAIPAPLVGPTKEEELLSEIRDLLKKNA